MSFLIFASLGFRYLTTIVTNQNRDACFIVQVTFIEALDQLMPGFDPEISKLAQRVLINPRQIDYHTGVFASKVSLFNCAFLILCYFLCNVSMFLCTHL